MSNTVPTFAKQDGMKFFRTLNSKVNNYFKENNIEKTGNWNCLLYTSPSPRDRTRSRMPSSA